MEAEDLFFESIREGKQQKYLNASRTGTRGSSRGRKGMNTPFDYMSKEEKKKLNGEVEVINMNETILPKSEFYLKDESLQMILLQRWRELYPNKEIMKQMGIYNVEYYDLVSKFGLPEKPKAPYQRRPKKVVVKETVPVQETVQEIVQVKPVQTNAIQHNLEPVTVPKLLTTGLHLEYNGDYSADQLTKIFNRLQVITEGEECKYTVSLALIERVS